jgi:hypothetical protein
MMTNNDNKDKKDNVRHKCDCGKTYKYRQGLHNHKRKCITTDVLNNNPDSDYKTMFLEAMSQNNKIMELLKEQSNTINQLVPVVGNNNNNTTTNTTNKFNMNVFLSEDCKDAINFSDFIKRIQVSVEDLENQTQLGYVNGIAKLFIDNIKELGVNKRPIHCTDKKRNTLYIKENDEWSKEGSQECVVKGIEDITRKTYGRLIELKADGDSAFSNKCLVIQKNLIPTHPRENSFVKIVGHISDKTTIEENQRKLV